MSGLTVVVTIIYACAAVIGVIASVVTWSRRGVTGARPLGGMILAGSLWAACDAVEVNLGDVGSRILVSQIQYLGVFCISPLFVHASVALTRLERLLGSWWARVAIWGIPVATLAVAWVVPWQRWLWTSVDPPARGGIFAVYHYGPWFWIFAGHSYLLLGLGTGILVAGALRVARPFRLSMRLVVLAVALPWLGNVAYDFKLGPWPGFNWLSMSLIVSGSMLAWATAGAGLFDLLPKVREAVAERITDAVFLLDSRSTVLWSNPGADRLVASAAGTLPPELAAAVGSSVDRGQQGMTVPVDSGEGRRWFELRVDPVADRWGAAVASLVVARDITARHQLEVEREKLITELQQALAEVRTLEGLLPICAGCKKVRDDGGYWNQIEEYLSRHIPVQFSHGLCPECVERLYGDLGLDLHSRDGEARDP